ncbi:hypothetical protein SAMN05421761_10156 [Belliella pelovolcani]|uniref:Outer membrane protein beta-barrel domain-containing protein n=2 Tax=Belliella pelovolcani TaxID=529505 RepID=A0A1N7JIW4_9BACT|nr:hypothetical protein SAMN05421761_10156 [Belliella pelovolcani]
MGMKKIILILFLSFLTAGVFAQQHGEARLMAGGDYRLTIKDLGTFIGVEYFFADRLSLAPTFTVWFPDIGNSFNLNADLKYYLTEGVSQVYVLAGYSNYWINTQQGDPGLLQTRPGGNLGVGAYLAATEKFGFITEVKMQSQNTRWPVLRVGAVLNLN